jgi:hypothetical protein
MMIHTFMHHIAPLVFLLAGPFVRLALALKNWKE